MGSKSLEGLLTGVKEVNALRGHFAVRRGRIPSGLEADATKAHGRACVVLLSGHYERYFYAINEEAIEWVNAKEFQLQALPLELLLRHSQAPVDALAQTEWKNREKQLKEFIYRDSPLWSVAGKTGTLDHSQLLAWMKSPRTKDVTRLYRQYGIPNVFNSITRASGTRSKLRLDLTELVEKRNGIAHGDASVEALPVDVTRYVKSVEKFAKSADRLLARTICKLARAGEDPW